MSGGFFSDYSDINEFDEYEDEELDVLTINNDIRGFYADARLSIELETIQELAPFLNSVELSERAPSLEKLYEIDCSLGPCGFDYKLNVASKPRTYSFYQILKYDRILRPIKYVYMPFGMSSYPASFSRDIAQNACAYVEMCMQNLFLTKGLRFNPKAPLGTMLYQYQKEFDTNTFKLIEALNRNVYVKAKHEFSVNLPKKQLLTLSESLASYLVCRVIGLALLKEAGVLEDIINLVKLSKTNPKEIVIGQTWYV